MPEVTARYTRSTGSIILSSDDLRPTPEAIAYAFIEALKDYLGPNRRPTLEEIKKLYPEHHMFINFALSAVNAEVFDFGEFSETEFKREVEAGRALMREGLIRPPYNDVIYWSVLTDLEYQRVGHDETDKLRSFMVIHREPEDKKDEAPGHYFATEFILLPPNAAAPFIQKMGGRYIYVSTGTYQINVETYEEYVQHPYRDEIPDRWEEKELRWVGGPVLPTELETKDVSALAVSLSNSLFALSMIVNTKNVELRKEHTPPKVQAKRVKRGKSPYPTITYVNTKDYFLAAKRTAQGGTHASPQPHLRRGHRRTLATGKEVWVRSALVNCVSVDEITKRDHYEVGKV